MKIWRLTWRRGDLLKSRSEDRVIKFSRWECMACGVFRGEGIPGFHKARNFKLYKRAKKDG